MSRSHRKTPIFATTSCRSVEPAGLPCYPMYARVFPNYIKGITMGGNAMKHVGVTPKSATEYADITASAVAIGKRIAHRLIDERSTDTPRSSIISSM